MNGLEDDASPDRPPVLGAPAWLRLSAGAAALGTGAWLGLTAWLRWRARGRLLRRPEEVGPSPAGDPIPWALVLGCLAHPDGRPSRPLRQRLQTARALHATGRVERILVSGVGHETAAMRRWLQDRGVPAAALVEDPEGVRTHVSMWRARHRFQVREAVLCTQAYHLPRALWLAEACGIEALGVAADGPAAPRHPRPPGHRLHDGVREASARGAAVADVLVSCRAERRG